jgi:hypothetical protein
MAPVGDQGIQARGVHGLQLYASILRALHELAHAGVVPRRIHQQFAHALRGDAQARPYRMETVK